ncbi:hypothetical protein [Variovorax sp. OV329]|uniref:hypothetical protein n=1 Tax=Variovorax sp. OV329 TaxID=1882825 RepID=UPI0008DF7CD4|nr:hypothetical protein [Variovorax sp. OV329]SFN06944.1 hypothetical protein SAMN05444747_11480 [Variovorax sp. OV329]
MSASKQALRSCGADDDKMIQTPTFRDALASLKSAAKNKTKAAIRIGARIAVKIPALKKILVDSVKRFPGLDRRMRAAVNPFDAANVRRASGPSDLSPAAQAVLRRLHPKAPRNP